eukprot:GHVS01028773.1.p1 GENE.GHVS01028773.1~~GHVS01028773.1.p1  ORF type:complete len:369 (-),score=45.17 GHVS01028773.1:323-1429(-)
MNEILPLLYLGGLSDAEKTEMLLSMGIRGVVMCCTYMEKPLIQPSSATPSNNNPPTSNDSQCLHGDGNDEAQTRPQAAEGSSLCICSSCPSSNTRDPFAFNGANFISCSSSDTPPQISSSSSDCWERTGEEYRRGSHEELRRIEPAGSQEEGLAVTRGSTVNLESEDTDTCSSMVESALVVQHDEPPPILTYYRVCLEDTSCEPIKLYFEEVGEFIDSFMVRGEGVLVHCKAGVSRSATIIISYLVGKMHFSLARAFYHVLSRRKIICPNVGFMEQLGEYEVETKSAESLVEHMDSSSLAGQREECEGNSNLDGCGQNKRDDAMAQRGPQRATADDSSMMPSVCLFKYIDWYTADLDRRAGVPDIEPG